jgi:HlyD family secretion protein
LKLRFTFLVVLTVAACSDEVEIGPMFDNASVRSATIDVGVSSAGIVEPLATVEVKSKASGEVLELFVETGDLVEEGTLMVRIDPRTVRNRLDQSEAELKAANSRREIAQSQMERAERLLSQGTFTQADLEQAALDLANAEAQVVTARVSVENARIAVDDTDIRAPITGAIIQKPVEKGQVISSPTQDYSGGSLLLSMADLSAVQIRALVDETDIGKVRPGMSATVSVAAYPNQPFPGQVIKIEPQAVLEQNVTMFAVLISIENPDGLLLPGMNAEVDVRIARSENVLTVPVMALRTNRDLESTASILGVEEQDIRDALLGAQSDESQSSPGQGPEGQRRGRPTRDGSSTDYRFGGKFWVVVDTGGDYEFRNIVTGITDLDRVEIIEGLQDGESLLVLPSTHLVETQQELQNWINRRIGRVPGIR